MESTPEGPEFDPKVIQAFRTRIAKLVLPDEGGIDRRDAMLLMDCDVLRMNCESDPSDLPESNSMTFVRQEGPYSNGPLVFYKGEGDKPSVARARDLLLDRRIGARQVALSHLEMTACCPNMLDSGTRDAITLYREAILTEQGWRRAAINLATALDDDWLLNLNGILQISISNIQDYWEDFITPVLHPSMAAVQRCSPGILCTGLHQGRIENYRAQLVKSEKSIDFFCSNYLEFLGHLPFSQVFGLSQALKARDITESTPTLPVQILKWAEQAVSPFARYQTCEVLLSEFSQLLPEQRDLISTWFWEAILPPTDPNQPSEEHAEWDLAEQLARYYLNYMEVRLPSDHGEAISAMAWWMAKMFVGVWSAAGLSARSFSEHLQRGEGAGARAIRDLTCPPIQPSLLYWLTLFGPSPWALSLLSSVTNQADMQWLMTGKGPGTETVRIAALSRLALMAANLPLENSVYRFSDNSRKAFAWAFTTDPNESNRDHMSQLATGFDWSSPDSLKQALEALEQGDGTTQIWLCNLIRQRIENDALNGDELWAVVSRPEWKSGTWLTLDLAAVEAICVAIINDTARRSPDWAPQLPHLLAEIAEGRSRTEDDRVAMFTLLLRACCALNMPSGITRLMRGRCSSQYRLLTSAVKLNIEQILPQAGGWGSGRLRALLVDLL